MILLNATELTRFEMGEGVNFVFSSFKILKSVSCVVLPALDFLSHVFLLLPSGPLHMLVLLSGMLVSPLFSHLKHHGCLDLSLTVTFSERTKPPYYMLKCHVPFQWSTCLGYNYNMCMMTVSPFKL